MTERRFNYSHEFIFDLELSRFKRAKESFLQDLKILKYVENDFCVHCFLIYEKTLLNRSKSC